MREPVPDHVFRIRNREAVCNSEISALWRGARPGVPFLGGPSHGRANPEDGRITKLVGMLEYLPRWSVGLQGVAEA